MLTPVFEITQEKNVLVLMIKAPFAKVSETEIFIEENEFKFYSKPYYLRLTLPGNIVENGKETADYDAETGVFHIRVPKERPGEHFEGLDMLTKLLAPKGLKTAAQPLIEVISEQETEKNNSPSEAEVKKVEEEEEEEFDWQIEQEIPEEDRITLLSPKYGFANQRAGVLNKLQAELLNIVDVKNPDDTTPHDRHLKRLQQENEKFDEDHYFFSQKLSRNWCQILLSSALKQQYTSFIVVKLQPILAQTVRADLYEDELIQEVMKYKPPWTECKTSDTKEFSDKEKEKMLKLPRKEYLLDERSLQTVYFGLVDILFAYAYDYRTTYGEKTVESGWTVCKLSSTLSWLERFVCLKDVLVSSIRRCLCFPLYRHWELCIEVLKDTINILSQGRNQVLKCLLDIHTVLSVGDPYYIINDLYITDYCVWIQSVSDKKLISLSESLQKITVSKDDIGFELTELEEAAVLVMNEDTPVVSERETSYTIESVMQDMSDLHINNKTVKCCDSIHHELDSDDDSTCSDSSSEYSTCSDEETSDTEENSSENDPSLLNTDQAEAISESSGISDSTRTQVEELSSDTLEKSNDVCKTKDNLAAQVVDSR